MSNIQILDANGVAQTVKTTFSSSVNTPWHIVSDGTNAVTVAQKMNSTALTVQIVDASGNQITNFGSGTIAVTQSTSPWSCSTARASLSPVTPAATTVGVSSGTLVASNGSRKGLILTNTSANTVSLGFGAAAVLDHGITLAPGAVFRMDEYSFYSGAINAIASSASSNVAIQEFS